jgi:hypothetical protein
MKNKSKQIINSNPRLAHEDILIKNKWKQIMKLNSQSTQCWMIKLKKNQLNKRHKKQLESTRVNPLSIILGSWDQDNLIKSKQNKLWNLIHNQINIKGWN